MNTIHVWPKRLKNFLRHLTCNSPQKTRSPAPSAVAGKEVFHGLGGRVEFVALLSLPRRNCPGFCPSTHPGFRCVEAKSTKASNCAPYLS